MKAGLDINLFRTEKGGNPDIVRQSCVKRGRDPKIVDQVIDLDKKWREVRFNLDQLKKEWNQIGKEITEKMKANKQADITAELARKGENEAKQADVEKEEKTVLQNIEKLVNSIGNLVHESVPVSNDEENNAVVRTWGVPSNLKVTGKRGAYHHHEVLEAIDGYDPKRGQKVAGHRGYFLKGPGVRLNLALINYGISFLTARGYEVIQPPFFMKKQIMSETCQLSDFEESLYQVNGGSTEDDDYFMIATSEQPISALHRNEWLDEKSLPIKYAGYSSCFRKEAGAHGKDNWGIFRVHQFEKIEQFVICKPEDSWNYQEEMIRAAEEFYQSLELPYQVINIVSGALNDAAARKYDLEAWFPGYNSYRELVSCSNCTDYQSRNLEIRCGTNAPGKKDDKNTEKKYVHMLNATLTATERTLCCILENYQTEDGVRVPKALQPFYGGDFIPYVKEVTVEKEEKKKEPAPKKEKKPEQVKPKAAEQKKTEEPVEETKGSPTEIKQ